MRVLITAGPTREKIDPVRFITNYSSGKMGYALAQAAAEKGHDVVLVSGTVTLKCPESVKEFYSVESAAEMAEKAFELFPSCDAAIMVAAVADYRPNRAVPRKQRHRLGIPELCFVSAHDRSAEHLVPFAELAWRR